MKIRESSVDRVFWNAPPGAVWAVAKRGKLKLMVAVQEIGDGYFSVLALETSGVDAVSVLDNHAHKIIAENVTAANAKRLGALTVRAFLARRAKRSKRCDCEEIAP